MNDNVHLNMPVHASGPAPEDVGTVTLLIHGRTQGPADMFAIAERLALPGMAYQAVEAFEKSWYPDKFMAPLANNQPLLDHAVARIDRLIHDLEARGIPRERIALLGFSQGACLASEYVYRYPQRWGALIAYTGGLIGPEGTQWALNGTLADTPVLLANSDADAWVPLSRTEQTLEVFRAMGAAVQLRVYPGLAHEVNDEEIALGRALLQPLLNGPSTGQPSLSGGRA
ncbi:phospholipase/carboxylesterase [Pseudomonas sp. NFACC23-1]|uniref:alpha/beta hydrolase n=1 Tax=unclassified Pseudomonas TaxID=196821 RepID=UPI00087F0A80|nr:MULTISPECIES: dienelactone hydrolase family protein [unclassified Pseudomonas]SDB50796.1 phospholipase/carboxylesterase [Pseudomonas sp. NFACC17-2]SEI92671.1 phospholipase/carboxylesterase [Pseudomonas sp. NFACC23-1]SFW85116.1 phospholipase/carboxylesterase [Pseudomonas sp. NFACC16-2]